MRDLSSAGYAAAFDFIGTMTGLSSPAERGRFALEALGRLVPSDVRSINVVDLRRRSIAAIDWPPGTCSPSHLETLMRLVETHPVIAHCARTHDFRPHRISDFVTRERFESSALYSEFYRVLSLRHELVSVVPTSATRWICIGLDRGPRCSDFSDRERALLTLIMPSLVRGCPVVDFDREPAPEGLTVRERDVLRLVCAGATNREIGCELGISPRTVQTHLEHIFEKLGVRTRTAAASALLAKALA